MCRPRDFDTEGGRIPRRRSLKIDSVGFHLKKLSSAAGGGGGCGEVEEADWVSLVLMPRMDGSPLVVNGSKIAADMPAFITLHRVTNDIATEAEAEAEAEAVFRSSRDIVEGVCDGLSLELHFGQHCLVRGIFRCCKSDKKGNGDWNMECKWVAKPEIGGLLGIREAILSVGVDRAEECSVLTETIQIRSHCRRSKRWRGKRCGSFKMCLQDIPEVDEDDDDDDEDFVCYCNCGLEYENDIKMEDDYGWAVDASFWALCVGLGLGYMVSRTSRRTLNLSKFLPL